MNSFAVLDFLNIKFTLIKICTLILYVPTSFGYIIFTNNDETQQKKEKDNSTFKVEQDTRNDVVFDVKTSVFQYF